MITTEQKRVGGHPRALDFQVGMPGVVEGTTELVEDEQRLGSLLANLRGMAYRVSIDVDTVDFFDRCLSFVSDGCRPLLGLTARQLTSEPGVYHRLIHPQDRPRLKAVQAASLATGEPIDFEYRLVLADGSLRWVWDRAQIVGDRQKGTLAMEGFVSDITAQRQAEEKARRQLEQTSQFQAALLAMHDQKHDDLPAVFRFVTEQIAQAVRTERVSLWFFDGSGVQLECHDLFTHAENRHQQGIRLAAADYPGYFTALGRKNTIVADNAWTHPDTCEFSEAYLKPLGITSMLDVPIRLGQQLAGVMCLEHVGPLRQWSLEEQEFAASAAGFVMLILENSERRRVEEELRQAHATIEQERADLTIRVAQRTAALESANQELVQANRVKSEFMAMISHELRTPLNGVLGMNELLRNTPLTSQQREFVQASDNSGRALLSLINDVLDISKIEAGRMELEMRPCDLGELAGDVVAMFSHQAKQKGLELVARLEPMGRSKVLCDETRLRQILVNLVGNAIKFTKTGQVELRSTYTPLDAERIEVQLAICDTGIGIPAERMDQLFQPFSQVDRSTTRRFGGTGLGLSIAKQLAELMGGEIGVNSDYGSGSTFWVRLPLQIVNSRSADRGQEAADSSASFPPEPGTGCLHDRWQPVDSGQGATPEQGPCPAAAPPKTDQPLTLSAHVLVVEDQAINQMYIRELLKLLGCTCQIASNGVQALEALAAADYDLVLMDCQMPEMDGLTATREIRHLEAQGKLPGRRPIVALTANALKGDRQRCLDTGMDDYLSKPVDGATLGAVLQRFYPSGRCAELRSIAN